MLIRSVGLVVVLGPVGQTHAREAGDPQGVGVGRAAGDDVLGLVAAGAQRLLGDRDLDRARADPVALEPALER